MKPSSLLLSVSLMCVLSMALAGCYPITVASLAGSGKPVTKSMDLTGFSAVDASSAFQVQITQGESFSVSVTADDNLWDRVDVRKDGDTLILGLKQPGSYRNIHLSAKVTMPSLSKLTLSGASNGTVSGFKSSSGLTVGVSGASKLSGDVQAGNASFTASGASTVDLSGSADSLTIDGSGASTANLPNFAVNKANVTLSGASKASINVKSNLDYDLSGASRLSFTGSPTIGKMNTSGASSVDHK